jgi:hypothetical protein
MTGGRMRLRFAKFKLEMRWRSDGFGGRAARRWNVNYLPHRDFLFSPN